MPSKIVTATEHNTVVLDTAGQYLYILPAGNLYYSVSGVPAVVSSTAAGTSMILLGTLTSLPAAVPAIAFHAPLGQPSSGTLQNQGLISANGTAIGVTDASATIANFGTISGSANGIAIGGTGAVSLANAGTIAGGMVAIAANGGAQLLLSNSGLITSSSLGTAIAGTAGADSVVNMGQIVGSIELGQGDDLYDGRLGVVTGTVAGGPGRDTLLGDTGGETLFGNDGADEISGHAGNDVIAGGAGGDLLDGGEGFDLVSYADAPGAVQVDLLTDSSNEGEAALDELDRFEGVIGSAFADTLSGDNGANELRGGAGDDLLDGRAGTDTLRGGHGNDLIHVDNVRDRALEGEGAGADTVIASLTYRLGAAAEIELLVTSDEAGTTAINLTGSLSANVIRGNAGANRLAGLAGADTLVGLGGHDPLRGGDGNDLLLGGEGNDNLAGEAGDDTLSGDEGNDMLQGGAGFSLLTGGAGNDIFVFDAAGFSVITDYSGPEDTIRLPQALVPGLPTGVLAGAAFSATAAGVTAATRLYLDTTGGAPEERSLWFDPDGSLAQAAVQIGTILNGATSGIAGNDFVVIA